MGNRSSLCVMTAAVMLVGGLLCAYPGYGQSLTGRWALKFGQLDNGEAQREILELTQTKEALTGKLTALGFVTDVHGTVTGSHFELIGWDSTEPFLEGDMANGEMHGNQWGGAFEAHAATAADELPKLVYIEPPALVDVPYNGLAKTPPMGWNSWNLFAGKVTDQIVRTMADAVVSSGMRDAGYIYVNIDDTWEGVRDAEGNIQPNHKFPDMKALADYVHSKGLKFGIYSGPGPGTCGGYPASYGHELQDARTFAAWGVDYLKYDWCGADRVYTHDQMHPIYQKMGVALEATGRPIVYSLSLPRGHAELWGPHAGANLWRTTDDINDSWKSMIGNVENQVPTAPYGGPGHWNDPDMLEVGNGHMTNDEYQTHMSLWALVSAPLLAGNDLRTMSNATKAILMNREVIAIDQDPLGRQASPVKNGELETWVKPLADGGAAVGVVNMGATAASATVLERDLHLNGAVKTARDVWAHQDVQFKKGAYTAMVPSHGVLMLRVSEE